MFVLFWYLFNNCFHNNFVTWLKFWTERKNSFILQWLVIKVIKEVILCICTMNTEGNTTDCLQLIRNTKVVRVWITFWSAIKIPHRYTSCQRKFHKTIQISLHTLLLSCRTKEAMDYFSLAFTPFYPSSIKPPQLHTWSSILW